MPDLTGKTALITGANSGIGLVTARELAAHGARVILAGRDEVKLRTAVADIREERPEAHLDTLVVDLASLDSVRTVIDKLAADETIDLLINNAGVMNVPERRETVDGLELTVGTNHIGHFVLTNHLMPALKRAESARIVSVSAIAARWPIGRLNDLMSEKRYGPMAAYAKSKRANVVFTRELARRLDGTSIQALVVHPGAAMTNLQRHTQGRVAKRLSGVMERFLMGSSEGAAWPTLFAATSPDVTSGDFIGPAGRNQASGTPKVAKLPRGADQADVATSLWTRSEQLAAERFDVGSASV